MEGTVIPKLVFPAMQGDVREPQIRARDPSPKTEGCQHDLKSTRHVNQLTSLAR